MNQILTEGPSYISKEILDQIAKSADEVIKNDDYEIVSMKEGKRLQGEGESVIFITDEDNLNKE